MKYLILLIIIFSLQFSYSQQVGDFEGFLTAQESYLNGSLGNTSFQSGDIQIKVDYNAEWDSWIGWVISNFTSNQTPGFNNQYSAKPGIGAEFTDSYALSYAPNGTIMEITEPYSIVEGMYISNSTYAYYSMLNGDSFAKQFGGESGNDPDYFSLTIKAYFDGNLTADSVSVYLADYRFDDNSEDYIEDDWIWVDLENFGVVDSLQFTLHSSDNGSFGINTPTYFCIDQVYTKKITGITETAVKNKITLIENPVQSILNLDNHTNQPNKIHLYDASGRKLDGLNLMAGINRINLENIPAGNYFLISENQAPIKFIKL